MQQSLPSQGQLRTVVVDSSLEWNYFQIKGIFRLLNYAIYTRIFIHQILKNKYISINPFTYFIIFTGRFISKRCMAIYISTLECILPLENEGTLTILISECSLFLLPPTASSRLESLK